MTKPRKNCLLISPSSGHHSNIIDTQTTLADDMTPATTSGCSLSHNGTSWKGSSEVFRRLEGAQVYQPAIPCIFLLHSSLNHQFLKTAKQFWDRFRVSILLEHPMHDSRIRQTVTTWSKLLTHNMEISVKCSDRIKTARKQMESFESSIDLA